MRFRTSILLVSALFSINCASDGTGANSNGAVTGGSGPASAGSNGGPAGGAAGSTVNGAGGSLGPTLGGSGASSGGGGVVAAGGGGAAAGAGTTQAGDGGAHTGSAGAAGGGGAPQAGAGGAQGGTGSAQAGAAGFSGMPVDPSKKITVWLAGDSTMQPCATPCPCGWGSQFQAQFGSNVTVVDSGAGGRSIQTWLYDPNVTATTMNGECVVNPKTYSARWQAMLDPTKGMKAGDYLFIEFGINDGSPCPRHVGTALFQTYLGVMAQAAKDRGAQAIFLTSTSAMMCTGSMVSPNRGYGPQTKAAATANNVPIIDLTVLSAALYTSLGLCPNDSNYTSTTTALGKFFCNDHTHFEAAGAAQIAAVVSKALRDQSIGLAAYLK